MRQRIAVFVVLSFVSFVSVAAAQEKVPDPTRLVLGSAFVAFHGCQNLSPGNLNAQTCYVDYLKIIGKKSNGRVPVEDLVNGGVFYVRLENITYTRPLEEADRRYIEQRREMRELHRLLPQAPPAPGHDL